MTVGGEDDKVVLRSVESFDPLTSQWKSLACLPFAVSKHGLVVSGEYEQLYPPLCLYVSIYIYVFQYWAIDVHYCDGDMGLSCPCLISIQIGM